MSQSVRPPDWLNQALRVAPWRSQTQTTNLVVVTVIIVLVIGALYLAQASRTAAAGRRLQELEVQRQVLEQQNAQLRAEVAALRSVPRLISEAARLGFHPAEADEIEYLEIEGAPPSADPAQGSAPATAEGLPAYDQTLGSWLAEQYAGFSEGLRAFFASTFAPEVTPTPATP